MPTANSLWGAPRIYGEILKLGINVAQRTVSRLLLKRHTSPSRTWRTFLANHVRDLVSIDFFTVPTPGLRVLFVLVVFAHHRRRVVVRAHLWGPQLCRLVAGGLALLLSGCAAELSLTTPTRPVPELRGMWRGTWGGTPLTLFVLTQEDASPSDGISLGPWPLFGRKLPGLSGVLTFTVRGEAMSANVQGRLGDSNGRLTLVLEPQTPHGGRIILTRVGEHQLAGVGTSPLSWEPQGPVELVRQVGTNERPREAPR